MAVKTREKRERQELAGIPDSKTFVAPEGTFDDCPLGLPDGLKREDLTVAGLPLAELPAEAQGRILFQQTDQGMVWWERNERKLANRDTLPPMERGMRMATGGIATTPDEKKMLEFRDNIIDGVTLKDQLAREGIHHTGRMVRHDADPFAVLMEKHVPQGYSGLMMSDRQTARRGMVRGSVEYVPLLDKEGHKVKLGDMFLGVAPTDVVEQSKRAAQDEDRERRRKSVERVREDQDRIISDSKLGRIARKNRAGADFEGVVEDDPGDMGMQTDRGRVFAD